MNLWSVYFGTFLAALAVSAIAVPLCRKLAWRLDFLDWPLGEAHKRHGNATPLLGGMAIVTAWLLTVWGGVSLAVYGKGLLPDTLLDQVVDIGSRCPELLVLSLGGLFLAIMGLVDDKRPLGPGVKFFLQALICGVVACYPKLQVTLFWTQPVMVWAITVGWYLFILNAFNFFDNMDGLASGVAVIAACLFCVVAGLRGQIFVGSLSAITAGAALGFYFYNRNPASIFMGDSGSHFLGYMLAALGALTSFYQSSSPTVAPVLIPPFVLALPIFDTFAVCLIRIRIGQPIWRGDHNHISHRFHRMGMSRQTAVLLVHLLSLGLGLGSITLLWMETQGAILVLLQSAVMLALVSVLHSIKKETNDGTAECKSVGESGSSGAG